MTWEDACDRMMQRKRALREKGYAILYDYAWPKDNYWLCVLLRHPLTLHYLLALRSGHFKERDVPISTKKEKQKEES